MTYYCTAAGDSKNKHIQVIPHLQMLYSKLGPLLEHYIARFTRKTRSVTTKVQVTSSDHEQSQLKFNFKPGIPEPNFGSLLQMKSQYTLTSVGIQTKSCQHFHYPILQVGIIQLLHWSQERTTISCKDTKQLYHCNKCCSIKE